MKIVRPVIDLAEAKEIENAKASVAKQAALIEYVAMEAGVEIPEDEKEGADESEY